MRKPTPLWLGSRDSGSLSHSTFGNSQISPGSLSEGLLDTGLQILPLQTWTAPDDGGFVKCINMDGASLHCLA